MRRALKWVGGIVLAALALPALAILFILLAANIDPGRKFIETQVASLTGGMVTIDRLGGRFPDALSVGRITVSDAKEGPYVTVSDVVLDWSPLQLLHKTVLANDLHAAEVDVTRLPVAASGNSKSSGSFELPLRVDLRRLQIDKAVIGQPVAGVAATLALSGSADLRTLTEGTVTLDAKRLDSAGNYSLSGTIGPDNIRAALQVNEPPHGLIASVAHLPDLGAIVLDASANGPRNALDTRLALSAGALMASASGKVDLPGQSVDLTVKAAAPAMSPAPDVSWQSVLVDAVVHGPFTRPDANGTVRIEALSAAGARIGTLAADIKGNQGHVNLHATISDLHIPGPKPDIFAAAPVVLDAAAQLDAANRPVIFGVHHPLLSLDGSAETAGPEHVTAKLVLADMAPLAEAGGVDIQGSSDLDIEAGMQDGTTTASAKGRVGITGGMAPVPALIGQDGRIDVAGTMHGQDITLSHLTVNGKVLEVSANGGLTGQTIDLNWAVALSDIAAVQPSVSGKVDAKGHAAGALDDLAVQADIGADVAAKGYQSGHIAARVDASGLPHRPHAAITASGTLLDAPLTLDLTADQADGLTKVDISKANWKSLQAQGALSLAPHATLPTGKLTMTLARLADLQPFIGRLVTGQAEAALDSDDKAARLDVTMRDASLPGTASIAKAVLTATVTDPAGLASVDATFTADGITASSAKSVSARVTAKGPQDAIALTVAATSPSVGGGAAQLTTAGTLDATGRSLVLTRMEAGWKDQVLRLLAPAKFGFADGVSMDRVRLGFRQAELAVAGSAGSKLDLTASLRNLPADIAAIVDPSLGMDGVINGDARITGTAAGPQGNLKLTADGMHMRQGTGQALPVANFTANVALLGTMARIASTLTAGPSHVAVTGSAPLSATGTLDLRSEGQVDLAMLDPLLAAEGRRARGEVTLDASITGTTAAPRINGTADLRRGDVVDYALGAHVADIAATIQATGDTIRLTSLTGKAGPGTLSGSGTIGLAGAMPIDLRLTANNARPLSSDLLTALIDANLTLQGQVKGDMEAGGTLHVRRADIRIPDKLPASIAVLPVRDANAPPLPAPPPEQPSAIALNLTLDAPQQVFIRGRGLDAELGGTIHFHGTATQPQPDGGLHLRRGTFSVIGTTLTFSEGEIDFTGAGIADPSVHFVANSVTSTMTATLTVSGSARDPKITLSSVPDMPQDEILAQLLFNTSTSKLSPLQLAQIAAALASLSGATAGFDPLSSIRSTLGLDRLNVGSDSSGNPTLEAGTYIARGVYVGAKQGTGGAGPQATMQIDLAKGLKAEATAGSSTQTSATGASSSTDAASVGLTYRFEY